jgi:cytoskeletal protein CcmA (bactofilin family)
MDMKKSQEPISSTFSTVNANTRIIGEIYSDSDLRIDGAVEGNVNTKSKIILGPTARLTGDVVCQNADISCQVIGNVFVESQLKLNSSANIKGDIFTKTLIVESGALFNGRCEMGNNMKIKDFQNVKPAEKTKNETITEKVSEEQQKLSELF